MTGGEGILIGLWNLWLMFRGRSDRWVGELYKEKVNYWLRGNEV